MTTVYSPHDEPQLAVATQQLHRQSASLRLERAHLLDRAHRLPIQGDDDVATPKAAIGGRAAARHARDQDAIDLAVGRMVRRDLAQRGAPELRRSTARLVAGVGG